MSFSIPKPTTELINDAIAKFKVDEIENALIELLAKFPENAKLSHILLKVVAINSLYHTNILAVELVANHLHELGGKSGELDLLLKSGDLEIVEKISHMEIKGKRYNFFSFASKYCSWHNPTAYPVYDSRVEKYLRTLHNQGDLQFWSTPEKWTYLDFQQVILRLRKQYSLESFSFKDIDKFSYIEGGKLFKQ